MDVLIIDDDVNVRKSMARFFEKQGHRVFLESNGIDGLKTMIDMQPEVVFADIVMPYLNGVDLFGMTSRFQQEGRKMVLMSGFDGDELNDYIQQDLPVEFLSKPIPVKVLTDVVDSMNTTRGKG